MVNWSGAVGDMLLWLKDAPDCSMFVIEQHPLPILCAVKNVEDFDGIVSDTVEDQIIPMNGFTDAAALASKQERMDLWPERE